MVERRDAHKVLVGNPKGNRLLSGLRCRQMCNIKYI